MLHPGSLGLLTRCLAIAVTALLWSCSGVRDVTRAEDPCAISDAGAITYLREGGQYHVCFSRGVMYLGPTVDHAEELMRRNGEVVVDEFPTSDCSGRDLVCLQAEPFVFAVPRGAVAAGYAYETSGLRFVVENCANLECSIFDVKAGCDRWAAGRCQLHAGSSELQFVFLRFRYERGVGVRTIRTYPTTRHPYSLTRRSGILYFED